ncbi:hypothetical protein JCM19233_5711 [Vibrio astriarenae]|nr:hypothetical protein JCM19233_5711 [Vibrio sp. C7]
MSGLKRPLADQYLPESSNPAAGHFRWDSDATAPLFNGFDILPC